MAVEGGSSIGMEFHSFPYAGVNRIRFEGIVSVRKGNVSGPYQATPKEGSQRNGVPR